MEKFNNAIRTKQLEGGGVYVSAQVVVGDETFNYGQHYSNDSTKPTFAKDVPTAVRRFKQFYYPMYLTDTEQ